MAKAITSYAENHGGRVVLLFLLFLLAIYNFSVMGITGFALVCMIPVGLLGLALAIKYQEALFWCIFFMNYFVMGLSRYGYIPVPVTMVTLAPQLILLLSFLMIPRQKKNSMLTIMMLAIIIWTLYLALQVFNHTCSLPINIGTWLQNMNFYAFYFIIAYVLVSKIINTPETIMRFLRVWACFAIIAAFWAWRQKTFGWDTSEWRWLIGGAMRTHIVGGSIRYFSFFSDAANFGCSIAASAVTFFIVALNAKMRKDKLLFWFAFVFSTYGFFASGTRTALICFMAGIFIYTLLSKSLKLTLFVVIMGGLFVAFLAFTDIGNGNMQIRRMRSAFNKDDASLNVRDINKAALKKYLQDAPFGMGINIDETTIPANNKYKVVYQTSNDSTYVFFWQRTGIVGVYVFAFMNILIFVGGAIIILFRLKNKSCRSIASAFTCAFLAINFGGYANHILLQYPNILLFYGGMAIVYLLPAIEGDFEAYEAKIIAKEDERKRLKSEKKLQSRV